MDKRMLILGGAVLLGLVVICAMLAFFVLSLFPSECVAVIRIEGPLATQGSSGDLFSGGTTGSGDLSELIRQAEEREDVKAILFEINSPGGSVVASREIYESIKGARKPKVSYFREVAASGGYYVAAGSDYIISNPNAITGSIGVIATYQEMSGLFEKLGINTTVFKSGEHKDMGNPARPVTEKEKMILDGIVQEIFEEFKGVVVENRGDNLNPVLFNTALDGRILTGRQAYRTGLVDMLGNKQDALNKAAELGGIEGEPGICSIDIERSLLYEMFNGLGRGIGSMLSSAKQSTGSWSFNYR
ncbi:MAG: signal peptide peptidase SppA [Candidatus Micrarchaeota archaeon]